MRTLLWLPLALTLGCALEGEVGLERAALGGNCDDFLCTGNSPIVGGLTFWELDGTGLERNDAGMRLDGVEKNGNPLTLSVNGAWPVASGPSGVFSGAQLVGTTLRLELPDAGLIDVLVTGYQLTTFYDGTGRLPAFHLQYLLPEDPSTLVDLCPYATVDDQGLVGTWALISKGDRFDRDTTRIVASGAAVGSWINLSCAGDVIAKLLRLRHAEAAETFTHHTSVDQRQSGLNMFTANYCGDGELHTVFGQELLWKDRAGVTPEVPFPTFEAVWTAEGAACLSTPRYVAAQSVWCNPQPCTEWQKKHWAQVGDFASGMP